MVATIMGSANKMSVMAPDTWIWSPGLILSPEEA